MKKTFKRILALCISIILLSGLSLTTYAASTAYKNVYTNGQSYGSFKITTTKAVSQFTVQTQDFSSSSSVTVEVWNSNGTKKLSLGSVWINGNDKISNQLLSNTYAAGTYTIKYDVNFDGSGWIGVWLY